METQEITIRVDAETARAYEAASPEERRKLDLLLSLHLRQLTEPRMAFKQVMQEISQKVQACGLTEEKLNALLSDT